MKFEDIPKLTRPCSYQVNMPLEYMKNFDEQISEILKDILKVKNSEHDYENEKINYIATISERIMKDQGIIPFSFEDEGTAYRIYAQWYSRKQGRCLDFSIQSDYDLRRYAKLREYKLIIKPERYRKLDKFEIGKYVFLTEQEANLKIEQLYKLYRNIGKCDINFSK